MGQNVVIPKMGTPQTNRKESPDIWNDCPWEEIGDPRDGSRQYGLRFEDHFQNFPLIGTQTTQIAFDKYKLFASSSSNVVPVLTVNSVQSPGGILEFLVDTDNHGAHMAQSYGSYSMTGDATKDGKLWFECCIAVSSIVASHVCFLVGLAEVSLWTLAVGVPFSSDTGAAITNSAAFIGFSKPAALLGTVSTAVSDRATSFTAIGTSEATGITAFTFFKLGFTYDPRDTANSVRFFLNSVQLPTTYSNASLVATTNLKANNLGLIMAVQGGSAASSDAVFMDWWRIAQLFPL